MNSGLVLVVFLPAISGLVSSCFGFLLGVQGVVLLTTASLLTVAFSSYYYFYTVALTETLVVVPLFNWIFSGMVEVDVSLYFDALAFSIILLIGTVSTLVYIYAVSYLAADPHFIRFSSYISFFAFAMLILVTSNNFVQLFFGWELVGLISYLLIGFWYTRLEANKSALKAVFFNKVGDLGFLFALMLTYSQVQGVDFSTLSALLNSDAQLELDTSILSLIGLFFFVAAVGKSAQLGLHPWLPDAMQGPTPVSSLLHAASMVTVGVFLILRLSFLFENLPDVLMVIAFLGSLTAFFAATTGAVQNDIKATIAYSTASQLGYMVASCGLSNYNVALFHLITHGFFKALLFLSAGAIIHGLADEQDIRKMGSLAQVLPVSYACILIGSLSLMGFPFLSGFFFKGRNSRDCCCEL